MRHPLDHTGRDHWTGQNAENQFAALAQRHGYNVTKSTPNQDRLGHFDFVLRKEGELHKVEVKSFKSFPILKGYNETRSFFLVEFKGVEGFDGWAYGQANLIAFQTPKGFYLVPRRILAQVAEDKCTGKPVLNKESMLYNIYGRKGRADQVTAILIDDIPSAKRVFWAA